MIEFTVFGTPVPQGSMKAFYVKKLGRAVLTSDNAKLKPWRQELALCAKAAMADFDATKIERPGGVMIAAVFYFARPKSLKKSVSVKSTKPDVDKLLRSLGDSLTGICYDDDSQICETYVKKIFGAPERVEIRVEKL